MTDPTHDPQAALDELASAFLDGQTSYEEARRVAGDPSLLARVDRLRHVRDAVRLPDPPTDPARREAAIAAALIAAGHEPTTVLSPTAAADDLTEGRARRASARRWLPLVGVAAAIALAAFLVPQLGEDGAGDGLAASKNAPLDRRVGDTDGTVDDESSKDGRRDPSSREAAATLEAPVDPDAVAIGGGAGAGPAATGGDSGASTTEGGVGTTTTTTAETFTTLATPAGHLVDLGYFEDGDRQQLIAAARTAAEKPEATSPAEPTKERRAEIDACIAPMEATATKQGASVLYAAVAKMGKTTVVGIAVELNGNRQIRVHHLEGCEPAFEASLSEPKAGG